MGLQNILSSGSKGQKNHWFLFLMTLLGVPCSGQNVTFSLRSQSKPEAGGSRNKLFLYCMNDSSNRIVQTYDTGHSATTFTTSPTPSVSDQISGFLGAYHLSPYEPIYFILGDPMAEFQFSLKYQLFSFASPNAVAKFADHTYIAYTQTSYWELMVPHGAHFYDSTYQIFQGPYFYDNSFKPSLFYYNPVLTRPLYQLDLQVGTEHESNGKGGSTERSFFTAYVQPTVTFNLPENFKLTLQPRGLDYYWIGKNNQDIAQYYGYANLYTSLTWIQPQKNGERIQFATEFWMGDKGSHVGLQFDLRFNFGIIPALRGLNPTVQLQYFTGYGQTLLLYNQKSQAFRVGICLWY